MCGGQATELRGEDLKASMVSDAEYPERTSPTDSTVPGSTWLRRFQQRHSPSVREGQSLGGFNQVVTVECYRAYLLRHFERAKQGSGLGCSPSVTHSIRGPPPPAVGNALSLSTTRTGRAHKHEPMMKVLVGDIKG